MLNPIFKTIYIFRDNHSVYLQCVYSICNSCNCFWHISHVQFKLHTHTHKGFTGNNACTYWIWYGRQNPVQAHISCNKTFNHVDLWSFLIKERDAMNPLIQHFIWLHWRKFALFLLQFWQCSCSRCVCCPHWSIHMLFWTELQDLHY